jgi:hypothetical protein
MYERGTTGTHSIVRNCTQESLLMYPATALQHASGVTLAATCYLTSPPNILLLGCVAVGSKGFGASDAL